MTDAESLWENAEPSEEVSDHEASDGSSYVAVLRMYEQDGELFASIAYHPDLDLPEAEDVREMTKLECWKRAESFANQRLDGPYSWFPHSGGGYFCWLRLMRDPFAS